MDEIVVTLQDIVTTTPLRNHSELSQLDYASSGHTGFASSSQLTAEQNARIAADAELSDDISDLTDDLSDEEEAREAADTALQTAVNLRALITETGYKIDLELDSTNYKLTAKLYDKNNTLISTSAVIDLPIESLIVNATYDSVNKKLVLTLQNGQTIQVPLGDLISGLATETYVTQQVSAEALARSNADTALDNAKVDKITGKGLSTNDYTTVEKNKLAGIETGAEVNVQSDWNESDNTKDSYIKNKPNIPSKTSDLTNDGDGQSPFATESYVQVNCGKIDKIQKNGVELPITNKTVNITVPTNNNELTNGAGYITQAALTNYATSQDLQQGLATRQVQLSTDQLAAANSGINATKVAKYEAYENDIDGIESKISNAASSSNQLADKDFVNSSIGTNTSYFLGTLDVVTDLSLQYGASTSDIVTALNAHTFQTKTNNDYCFVINKDTNNNTIYQRFKYTTQNTPTFQYEYTLNNSSFTAAQWLAISSGINASKVSTYDNHVANTNNPHGVTKNQVGLGNVDNTSDINKPVSTAQQNAINAEKSRAEAVEATLQTALGKRLQVVDGYVANANLFLTNGVGKTDTSTTNLPLNEYEQDRWGVLEYVAENESDNTGVQIWKCIAYSGSTHRGEIYTRTIISGTPTAWKKITTDSELSAVAKTGAYSDLSGKPTIPTVNDPTIAIQKNGTTVDSFTLNQASGKTINITVPTTAAGVNALPDTTKYGASLSLSLNTTNYKITANLKDQDGNTLGTAQEIDLPIESVVVNGSYNSTTKKVVLTLQNGSTIEFSVADLISGLQTEITSSNKLPYSYISGTPKIPTVDQTYSASSTNAQSGTAVASAINAAIVTTINGNY